MGVASDDGMAGSDCLFLQVLTADGCIFSKPRGAGMSMNTIRLGDLANLTVDFLPRACRFPYRSRNRQSDAGSYRPLKAEEIEILVKNNNTAENWNKVLVTRDFDPNRVRGCEFLGLVRIGDLGAHYLEFHDLRLPVGLVNCVIVSCDIGNQVVMRNVHLIAHYIIRDCCMLFNIDEITTTNHAKFGVGIVKQGEKENVRVWLEAGNENGGRKILPFEDLLPADAYLWCKFRGNKVLMQRFKQLTERTADRRRGIYGEVDSYTVIKNCMIIKDAKIGSHAYIKGANKLKNLTILSSAEEPTQIGEGVELVNGIVGFGSRIFYGCKAVRFVTGRNTQLKYGARLLNSVLGDNSTVSCCEILNNLIFPFHEQHHNNSFLIATTVLGQSNIAANATIGSNHNSRSPDGEIVAGRGFWPGLGVSLKHNSRFASFVLINSGRYHHELNIPIPFSLVCRDDCDGTLQVMPAYWFLYNMYAIARNNWKFKQRDKRVVKAQPIATDILAPDTVDEMWAALELLLPAIGRALLLKNGALENVTDDATMRKAADDHLAIIARDAPPLQTGFKGEEELQVVLAGLENSRRPAHILKPLSAVLAFRDMILFYAVSELVEFLHSTPPLITGASNALHELAQIDLRQAHDSWVNLGGQLVPRFAVDRLVDDVVHARLTTWQAVHARYQELWQLYPQHKAGHALASLQKWLAKDLADWTIQDWRTLLLRAQDVRRRIAELTVLSRKKDYTNPFRTMVYEDRREMEAVLGRLHENPFFAYSENEKERFEKAIEALM